MILSEDFEDFIRLLNKHKVKYLVVGGYAVAYYGFSRYTGDFDIWIKIGEVNAKKMIKVFNEFGFTGLFEKTDFLVKDKILQVGREPNRIDVLTGISGIDFDEAYSQKNIWNYEDELEMPFIHLNDLLRNKKESGRNKDLIDIEELKKRNKKK